MPDPTEAYRQALSVRIASLARSIAEADSDAGWDRLARLRCECMNHLLDVSPSMRAALFRPSQDSKSVICVLEESQQSAAASPS